MTCIPNNFLIAHKIKEKILINEKPNYQRVLLTGFQRKFSKT